MPLPYFRHRSPYYYLAWAGLYLILGLLALAGVPIPLFFGRNLAAGGDLTPPFPPSSAMHEANLRINSREGLAIDPFPELVPSGAPCLTSEGGKGSGG